MLAGLAVRSFMWGPKQQFLVYSGTTVQFIIRLALAHSNHKKNIKNIAFPPLLG